LPLVANLNINPARQYSNSVTQGELIGRERLYATAPS
jgi:hypothetical protein